MDHAVEINFKRAERLQSLDGPMRSRMFTLMRPSEHQFGGRTYPMEVNLCIEMRPAIGSSSRIRSRLRQLSLSDFSLVGHNARPIQPLNDRESRKSTYEHSVKLTFSERPRR